VAQDIPLALAVLVIVKLTTGHKENKQWHILQK
jgi:hypothetical protein